ncbi:MAG: hypothetical protein ACJAVL_000669 [Bacteroidia bacterium]|jgi:hypothetical protein
MEDFGNIVYVLAAIAWFAWNTYKKSQGGKKKPATASGPKPASRPVQQREESKSLEDMVLEQFGQKNEEPIRHEPKRHQNADKLLDTDLTHSYSSENHKMSESEMKSHRIERQVRKLEVVELEQESIMDSLVPNGFDLRQAVVLNAILERPYK